MMKLSIIIPVYNCGQFLNECMDSIVPEIDEEVEVLLIDDGSQDDSYEICKSYEASNIRVWHQENQGVSYTRNFGIEQAKGDYIMFVDADDKLMKGWYDIVQNAAIGKDSVYFSKNIKVNEITKDTFIEEFCRLKGEQNLIGRVKDGACSKIYSRDFLKKKSIQFKEKIAYGEDRIFSMEAAMAADTFGFIKESFYLYRYNENSAVNSFNEQSIYSDFHYIRRYRELMEKSNLIDKEKMDLLEMHSLFNSMYKLLYRISKIENKQYAYEKMKIFEIEEFNCFFNTYKINTHWEWRINISFLLLKNKLYRCALFYRRCLTALRRNRTKDDFDLI